MTDTESTNPPASAPEDQPPESIPEAIPEQTPVPESTPGSTSEATPSASTDPVAAEAASDDGASEDSSEVAASEKTVVEKKPVDKPPVELPVKPTINLPEGQNWWWGTGRRKASVARVRIRPGEGKFLINKREYDKFFTEERDHNDLMNVLEKTNTKGAIDVHVKVHGGGYTGQAGAVLLGLARALKVYDPSLEPILRDNDFLTRDPRRVERKKYGQPGARKRFQFSKR